MDLQSGVDWSGPFSSFFVSGGKNDPKNTNILKTNQTFLGKHSDLFSKIFSQNF